MSPQRTSPPIHPARTPAATAAAVDALCHHQLIILPTETIYGLAANAASPEALSHLFRLIKAKGATAGTWHAPGPDPVRQALNLTSPIHQRLLARLLPGPVTLVVERTPAELDAIRSRWGVTTGTLDDGKTISIRVPDHPAATAVLAAASEKGITVIAQGVRAAGWGDGRTIPDTLRNSETPSLGAILDDGPTRLGTQSTSVRLLASGGYRIEHEGALPARAIQHAAERTILFVCTGNTCRSPMAEAIARSEIAAAGPSASGGPRIAINILSAGSAAYDGDLATPETIDALKSLGIDTTPLARHRSRALTARMIDEADEVYAMTASHARAAASLSPTAASKVRLLDPDNADIPDPIGGTLEVYTRTAQRLRELIRRRLAEPPGRD